MASQPGDMRTERTGTEQAGEMIDAGYVGELEDVPFQPERHRAETARTIAYLLVGALVVSWLVHYAILAYFLWNGHGDLAKNLSEDFRTWLPVISGSAGGAVGYYFAKEK